MPLTSFSLAKFGGLCLLTSMCDAWQRSRTQNLRMVDEYSGPILSRLWTKVHDILRWCRRPTVVSSALADYVYHASFQRYRLLKLPLSCKIVEKGGFWAPILGEGIPQILDMHFRIALTLSIWPVLVEFHSASSEGSWRKKKEKEKEKEERR